MPRLSPTRWKVLSAYLDEALAMPEVERGAWLAALRERSPAVAVDLEVLLEQHRALKKESFLEHPLTEALRPTDDLAGMRCGSYRLLRLIGRGGMGSVYLGERADGEVSQRVAVKLLTGSAGDIHRERFLQERRILASLEHPNIARMLDAGHTDHGQPFLAMEYVEGQPIDIFAAPLDRRQKITLFLKVCRAVNYLHQNLVVHRDLKPANIFVTSNGEPKLLDFGIAKILDIATDTNTTAIRMLTPGYASPEQVAGLRVGTASDIYSLGAVLYELLTKKRAHEFDDSAPHGAVAVVIEREVTRPRKWAPDLSPDLESILLKALRKDPQERYGNIEQFAGDLEAYLESRPVRARGGNAWYRTRKLLRRHWVPAAAMAAVTISLSAGLYIANRARNIAERRFNDVRDLANSLFLIDRQVLALPGNAKARQLIMDTSLNYLNRLAEDARTDPRLALDVSTAYMRTGRILGVPVTTNLGQPDKAETNLRLAEQLIGTVLRSDPNNHMAHLRAAQIAHDRMVLAEGRRPDTEALPLARQSEAWLQKYVAGGKIDEVDKQQVVIAGMNIAFWYSRKGLTEDSLRLLRQTIEIAKAVGLPAQAGAAQINVARTLRSVGDLDGALSAIRQGVELLEPVLKRGDATSLHVLTLALTTEGNILGDKRGISMGRYQEAIDFYRRAYDIMAPVARRETGDAGSQLDVADYGLSLGDAIVQSDPQRALAVYEESLAPLAAVAHDPQGRRNEVRLLAASTHPLRHLGRLAEARKRLDLAFLKLRELKAYPADQVEAGSETMDALWALAEMEAGTGRPERGADIYQELIAKITPTISPQTSLADATELSELYEALAKVYRRMGKNDAASAVAVKQLALWKEWDQRLPDNAFVQRHLAGSR